MSDYMANVATHKGVTIALNTPVKNLVLSSNTVRIYLLLFRLRELLLTIIRKLQLMQ